MKTNASNLRHPRLWALLLGVTFSFAAKEPVAHTLLHTSQEGPSTLCEAGGQRIETGVDVNGDGVLEPREVNAAATTVLCATSTGLVVHRAAVDTHGFSRLLKVSAEPRGAVCARGGKRLEQGFDANADGVLNGSEVDASATLTLCDDDAAALINVQEPEDESCRLGVIGRDVNGNGRLEPSEVTSTVSACDATPDVRSLLAVETKSDSLCAQVETGFDANRNGRLEPSEVTSTKTVCTPHGASLALRSPRPNVTTDVAVQPDRFD